MPILNIKEFGSVVRNMERFADPTWTKPELKVACQAVVDRITSVSTKTALSGDIETVAPGVFTSPQKAEIVAFMMVSFFSRGGR